MASFLLFSLLFGLPTVFTRQRYKVEIEANLKYILPWTYDEQNSRDWHTIGFPAHGGRQGFIRRKCRYTNCYVTSDRNHLEDDYTKFHVIAFTGKELMHASLDSLPKVRSPHQKYAFVSLDPADKIPFCTKDFDKYFNWTWTYKLDSDMVVSYIFVKDIRNRIIGPKKIMHWMRLDEMDQISDTLEEKLKSKKKAAAWFVSNCETRSQREDFVATLNDILRDFDLSVDIYGSCGGLQCHEESHGECLKMISRDYYFYLAFEQAFSEDFVTEKLLHALQNDAVPIVYGGADYSMFMPDGIYLNARELGVKKLALRMHYLINNPVEYHNYFRWKNYYSYHANNESPLMDGYCKICEMLNSEKFITNSVHDKFSDWWNPPGRCPTKEKTIWDFLK